MQEFLKNRSQFPPEQLEPYAGKYISWSPDGRTIILMREHVMRTRESEKRTSEIAIFGRLIRADKGNLSRQLARFLLTLGFDQADQDRMQDLATRNQEGALSPQEKEELFNYVKAGHLLALLHSKARKSLQRKEVS
jgi:hypothetical protein